MIVGTILPPGCAASFVCAAAGGRVLSTTSAVAGLKADPRYLLCGGPSGASAERRVTAIRVQNRRRMEARRLRPPAPRLIRPLSTIVPYIPTPAHIGSERRKTSDGSRPHERSAG